MKKPQTIYNKGFTLIELLVVIGIISILSAVVLSSLTQAKAQADNTKQIADYRVVLNALLQFKQDNGYYPSDGEDTSACIGDYINDGGCKMGPSIISNNLNMKSSLQKYLSSYRFVDKSVVVATSFPTISNSYKGFILNCSEAENLKCKTATLTFPALKSKNSCPKVMSDIPAGEFYNNELVVSEYTLCQVNLD